MVTFGVEFKKMHNDDETDDDMIGHNSRDAEVSDDRLRLLIERVEHLEEEKKGIADDIKDVYLEAKAVGYDVKIMRAIVRIRKMQPDDRKEHYALLDTYAAALGISLGI